MNMNTNTMLQPNKRSFGALLGLLALACAGSLWAWLGGSGCDACSSVRDFFPGSRSLAPLGTLFYGTLLAWGVLRGGSRLFYGSLMLAASAHLVLLVALYDRGIACAPCLLVGGAAILAAGLSMKVDRENLARGSVLLPLGALLTQALFFSLTEPGPRGLPESFTRSLRAESPPPESPSQAELLVFSRAGCRYCEEFEEDFLPKLQERFGDRLALRRERAPAGLPTPTFVIQGLIQGAQRRVFPGLPPLEELQAAIEAALPKKNQNEVNHETSLLPESR